MNHLGLFEGIGGFSLAAKWVGWQTKAWCEINPFCQKVLRYHFPDAEGHEDITKTDFTKYANTIDIITGGFPCQPYSAAGKRKGKEDERHLWPEMLKAIRQVRPRWVVGENVLGITNWNNGLVFHEVQTELENEGYEVWSYVLPAAGVNAPHQRYRVWFVAYNNSFGFKREQPKSNQRKEYKQKRFSLWPFNRTNAKIWNASNPNSTSKQRKRVSKPEERQFDGYDCRNETNAFEKFPTQPPICGGNDGLPNQLDGITIPKWRTESIKAYGNAIVPQVVLQIFKAIEQFELLNND